MDPIAAGFWGAFFGTAALMLGVALTAYVRFRRSVALLAGLSAVVPAAFVTAYLGWLLMEDDAQARVLAHAAMIATAILSPLLVSLLGLVRSRVAIGRLAWAYAALCFGVLALGWTLPARDALVASWAIMLANGVLMLAASVRSASAGNRLARATVYGMTLLLLGLGALSWIALNRGAAWPVHALAAASGMGYLVLMASAAWSRFSYLLELSEVMAHGPSYDPVTRMRSHSETGQLVGDIFFNREAEARPIGVVAVCVGNLYALENLHGRAAFNHALFVCAGRLRRCVPDTMEMGRLGEDGFLLLTRSMEDMRGLEALARQIRDHLSRPVSLSTSREPGRIEAGATAWVADVGVGVLPTTTKARPAQAVATARAMARTAWTYGSRIAVFDEQRGQIAELSQDAAVLQPA
ncbi:MAG TPA: diguanylate cyclase [Ramlibacter sp.]|nr:diguanylate cyclase [Ramlibacter sp.]